MSRSTSVSPTSGGLLCALVCVVVLLQAFLVVPAQAASNGGFSKYCNMAMVRAEASKDDPDIGAMFSMEGEGGAACDGKAYANHAVKAGFACIAIAIIIVIAGIVFCFARCCDCCGGRGRNPGFCCVDGNKKKKYSYKEVIGTKAIFTIGTLLVAIALIVGPTSMGRTSTRSKQAIEAVEIVRDDVLGIVEHVLKTIEDINAKSKQLEDQGYDMPDNGVSTENAEDIRDSLKDFNLGDAEDQRKSVMKYAILVCLLVFIIPFIFVIIMYVAGVVFNKRKAIAYICFSLFVLLSIIIWILAAVHTMVATVSKDLCAEVDLAVQSDPRSIIRAAVPCQLVNFTEVQESLTTVQKNIAEGMCEVLIGNDGICNNGAPVVCDYSKMARYPYQCTNLTEVAEYPRKYITLTQPGVTTEHCVASGNVTTACTLADCAATCTKTQHSLGTVANLTLEMLALGFQTNELIAKDIKPLLSCDMLLHRFLGPFSKPCKSLSGGVGGMASGYVLLGVGFIIVMISLIWGMKRFMKLSKTHDYDEFKDLKHKGCWKATRKFFTPPKSKSRSRSLTPNSKPVVVIASSHPVEVRGADGQEVHVKKLDDSTSNNIAHQYGGQAYPMQPIAQGSPQPIYPSPYPNVYPAHPEQSNDVGIPPPPVAPGYMPPGQQ